MIKLSNQAIRVLGFEVLNLFLKLAYIQVIFRKIRPKSMRFVASISNEKEGTSHFDSA